MNKNKQWIVVAVVLLVVAGLAGCLYPREPHAAPQPAAALADPHQVKFPTGAAQLEMIRSQALPAIAVPVSDALSARVVYDEEATARLGVGISGRVVAIKAAPGDRVKAGQLLAEIDSADFGTALADLDKARADEERKRMIVDRARVLVPGEGIAGRDFEAAEADLVQAHAETVRARQRVTNLNPPNTRVQGQRLGLASPIAGVVVERTVNPSLEVSPGMAAPLFVVTDPKRLWLLIDVPEGLVGSVKVGTHVDVESDAFPGEHFNATVVQRGQVVDPETRRVVIRAKLDNPDGKLLPEMFVRSSLLEERGSAVRVPNSALVNRGLYTYVFVEPEPGRFERRKVAMLTHGADASYLGEGVAASDRIVTNGALLLDAEMSARAGNAP